MNDPVRAQRGRTVFTNSDGGSATRGLGDLLRWRREARRRGLPRPAQAATPQTSPDLAFLHANAVAGSAMVPAITWIGHATMLVQFGGINVLTDPVFSRRASPFSFVGPKRQQLPGVPRDALPNIDLVLISHNHYDHLDDASLRHLAGQAGGPPICAVPLGLREWVVKRGYADRVVELDWWESHWVGEIELVLTPARHWSARGLADRCKTLWGGWAACAPDFHFYFSGDTGYSGDFADIRRHFAPRQQDGGFDIAMLPIGAYEPRWFMAPQHVDPAGALRIHRDLGTKRSVGVHWGTFQLTDESLDAPPARLAEERRAAGVDPADFFVMALGETVRLPKRGASGRGG